MFGDEAGASPRTDLNRRALAYMQSDMYTPPEQIYDLGPRGRLKYEEAGDEEFTAVSNRLAREAAADERTKEDDFFAAEDVRFDAQRAADRAISRRIRADQPVPLDSDAQFADSMARVASKGLDFFNETVPNYLEEVAYARGFGDRAERKRADAAEETLMAMPVTPDPNKSEAQRIAEARAAADALIKDPNAMPKGGTSTGKKSGIAAEKSKMDQDKWLALAQAGFTLMSTGDFGKAGSAGLAALRESNKDAREERKLEAELVLREAQLAKANRAPDGETTRGCGINVRTTRSRECSRSPCRRNGQRRHCWYGSRKKGIRGRRAV